MIQALQSNKSGSMVKHIIAGYNKVKGLSRKYLNILNFGKDLSLAKITQFREELPCLCCKEQILALLTTFFSSIECKQTEDTVFKYSNAGFFIEET